MSRDLNPSLIKRASYSFELPESARGFPEKDIKKFKMRAYTLSQEIEAARIAKLNGDTQIAMTTELVRRSVYEIDGRPADDPIWLDEQSPGVRGYLGLALGKVTDSGTKADVDAFLASMAAVVD